MNVRVLLNTRIDLNPLKISPSSPYTWDTPMSRSTCTPDLSPTVSASDFSESPCPTPPHVSPHLPSLILPPPVVQTEESCATITTMDGRRIEADLIVGLPSLFTHSSFSHTPSFSVQARNTTPRFWRCCPPHRLTTRAGLPRMSRLLSNLGSRQLAERFDSLIIRTFLSSGMQPMLSRPESLAAQPGIR